ncbi:hypothetical protein [Nocardioides sp. ChNu-99]|uniref:hypothetical protein n=1 Tax=Nocardioides sp. ChNu-99 TaxID=2839897 RepID=UPI0024060BE7|nr:hypothetical protein [Nocardioides sp. ChNu-99]MDF9716035.1 hypothetical protein [Nocardioides sp. ChNu-99]
MPDRWPLVQYLASADPGARVMFSFNQETFEVASTETYPAANGWDFGSPELTGPADAAGRAWGGRVLRFPLVIHGPSFRTQQVLSEVARHVLRPGVLMFRLSPSAEPIFYRTFVGSPGSLDMSRVYADPTRKATWFLDVQIPVAPFAEGERITTTLPLLGNDPHDGGCTVTLPSALGDVPAPLTVSLRSASGLLGVRRLMLHMVASTRERAAAPVWWDLANLNQGGSSGWAGPVTADPAWPGSGYRATPLEAAQRTSGKWLGIEGRAPTRGVVKAGRYQMLGRMGTVESTAYFDAANDFRLRTKRVRVGPHNSAPPDGFATWAALADLTWPAGVDTSSLTVDDVVSGYDASVYAWRGVGTARFGGMLALPLDGPGIRSSSMLLAHPGSGVGVDQRLVVDGAAETLMVRGADGSAMGLSEQDIPRGEFPVITPGSVNQLTVLLQTAMSGWPDSAEAQTEVEISYRPRYLWLPSTALDPGAS